MDSREDTSWKQLRVASLEFRAPAYGLDDSTESLNTCGVWAGFDLAVCFLATRIDGGRKHTYRHPDTQTGG